MTNLLTGHEDFIVSHIFNKVEVGDKVFTSFTKLTMKSNKTGELYNKYFFNKIELQ